MEGMNVHATPPTTHAANAPPQAAVLLSVSDVCVALRCGRTFVYDLLQKGELRAIKLGRLTRISRAVLEEFIARSESPALDSARDEQYPADHRLAGRVPLVRNGKIARGPKQSAGEGRVVQQQFLEADG
jgi:excisionase family DNA binding protein